MSNQIDDFADFLAGITPEERATLSGLRDGTLVAVPRKLTAENGMKAALIGEFQVPFPHHDADGCEVVSQVNVPWTTIKKIHDAVVLAAAPEAPGRGDKP